MKALLLSEYGRLETVDVPMPRPGPEEVLIRVAACGICGSDVHGYDGTIAAFGPGVSGVSEGQPVTFDSTIYCGECEYCRRGEMNLCERRQVLGVATPEYRREGAFAQYVVVPHRVVHKLPGNIPLSEAAMIEPFAVAVHAVSLSNLRTGDTALVIGTSGNMPANAGSGATVAGER